MAHLIGTSGNDSLVGTSGDDTLEGLAGNDTLVGNTGNDLYIVAAGDVLSDSGGIDTIQTSISWHLAAGFENLTVIGTGSTSHGGNNLDNTIIGGGGANWISGREGNDTLYGNGGGDTFNMSNGSGASYGNDFIDGGDGVDTIDFGSAARTAVFVDLLAGTASGGGTGGAGSATVWNIENVNGGGFDDRIVGNASANFLYGFNGNDTLDGGAGNDRLEGAAGNDQYVFSVAPGAANADTIIAFASGADKIVLMNLALGSNGNFAAGDARFAAGAGFNSGRDASDRVIYNTTTGQLWYDADGNASGAAQLIATLQGAPAFAATDITAQGSISGGAINGTPGNDSLVGTTGGDTIDGKGGDDTIDGFGGSDVLIGGTGNDWIYGGIGEGFPGEDPGDRYVGGDGNDTLNAGFAWHGSVDADTLEGGLGDDLYLIDHPGDVLSDAGGVDTVVAYNMDWTLALGFENLHIDNDVSEGPNTGIGNDLDNVMSLAWGGGRLEGRGGDDTLFGGHHHSALIGGAGDDLLEGGEYIDGGAGNDTMSRDMFATFSFSVAPGPANADVISNFASGNDLIQLDGNVYANSGMSGRFSAGDARFYAAGGATGGHDADDRVVLNTSTGQLFYDADGNGSGAAQIIATLPTDSGLAATDIEILNGSAANVIVGGPGDDSLVGTNVSDTLLGFGGNDTLQGAEGNDSMDGGTGNDTYHVTAGDVLADAGGTDLVIAVDGWILGPGFENLVLGGQNFSMGTGNELANDMRAAERTHSVTFRGGAGDDTLVGDWGEDALFGEDGNDELRGEDWKDRLHGGAGNDLMFGENGDDTLDGGMGNDAMFGGAGSDRFFMFDSGTSDYGEDSIDGGAGFDNVQFLGFESSGVVVNLASGTASGGGPGGAGQIALTGIESIIGTRLADRMTGSAEADFFNGHEGNDTLDGGGGTDDLHGGQGADAFFFSAAPGAANADFVGDFASGTDALHLDASAMTALGASGRFGAGDARFHSAAGATAGHDADDRVVYNTSTNELFYDADGSGSGAAQRIATLGFGAPLAATDIVVENGSAPPPPSAGQTINGTTGNDTLNGTAGNDTINGLAGTDVLNGLGGNDSLLASTGHDTLNGGDGNDWLQGGGWSDTLTGGAGNDSFVWAETGTGNRDTVVDFTSGSDELLFENGVLAALGAASSWAAGDGRFWAAAGATSGHDADDRLVYNTSTGNLYYDADGSGAGAAQIVATFQGNPFIAASDITVI